MESSVQRSPAERVERIRYAGDLAAFREGEPAAAGGGGSSCGVERQRRCEDGRGIGQEIAHGDGSGARGGAVGYRQQQQNCVHSRPQLRVAHFTFWAIELEIGFNGHLTAI